MGKIDILIIHRGREITDREDVLLSPLGTFYLADYLHRNGIKARMLNWPLLRHEPKGFDIDVFLKAHEIQIVALDLHWHPQSFSVIKFAGELKARHPRIKIILGGSTASFFASEIMENFGFIDAIVRGDSEVPLLEYVWRFQEGEEDLLNVPNLAWRRQGEIIFNGHEYTCGLPLLESMDYPRFDLLINDRDSYLLESARFFIHQSKKMIFYNPGRGCPGACQFCGGGSEVQHLIYKRDGLLWPSLSSVRKTLLEFEEKGIECLYLPFSCPAVETFYTFLFKGFREKPLKFDLFVETFNLPGPEFISALKGAVLGEVTVVLSPDTGNEALRMKIKSFAFSNLELIQSLKLLEKYGAKAKLFFSTGFAGEKPQDLLKTKALIRFLKQRFSAQFDADTIELEPGSPLYSYPEKYGIQSSRKCFSDFMAAAVSPERSVGYDTRYFKDAEIIANCDMLERECQEV